MASQAVPFIVIGAIIVLLSTKGTLSAHHDTHEIHHRRHHQISPASSDVVTSPPTAASLQVTAASDAPMDKAGGAHVDTHQEGRRHRHHHQHGNNQQGSHSTSNSSAIEPAVARATRLQAVASERPKTHSNKDEEQATEARALLQGDDPRQGQDDHHADEEANSKESNTPDETINPNSQNSDTENLADRSRDTGSRTSIENDRDGINLGSKVILDSKNNTEYVSEFLRFFNIGLLRPSVSTNLRPGVTTEQMVPPATTPRSKEPTRTSAKPAQDTLHKSTTPTLSSTVKPVDKDIINTVLDSDDSFETTTSSVQTSPSVQTSVMTQQGTTQSTSSFTPTTGRPVKAYTTHTKIAASDGPLYFADKTETLYIEGGPIQQQSVTPTDKSSSSTSTSQYVDSRTHMVFFEVDFIEEHKRDPHLSTTSPPPPLHSNVTPAEASSKTTQKTTSTSSTSDQPAVIDIIVRVDDGSKINKSVTTVSSQHTAPTRTHQRTSATTTISVQNVDRHTVKEDDGGEVHVSAVPSSKHTTTPTQQSTSASSSVNPVVKDVIVEILDDTLPATTSTMSPSHHTMLPTATHTKTAVTDGSTHSSGNEDNPDTDDGPAQTHSASPTFSLTPTEMSIKHTTTKQPVNDSHLVFFEVDLIEEHDTRSEAISQIPTMHTTTEQMPGNQPIGPVILETETETTTEYKPESTAASHPEPDPTHDDQLVNPVIDKADPEPTAEYTPASTEAMHSERKSTPENPPLIPNIEPEPTAEYTPASTEAMHSEPESTPENPPLIPEIVEIEPEPTAEYTPASTEAMHSEPESTPENPPLIPNIEPEPTAEYTPASTEAMHSEPESTPENPPLIPNIEPEPTAEYTPASTEAMHSEPESTPENPPLIPEIVEIEPEYTTASTEAMHSEPESTPENPPLIPKIEPEPIAEYTPAPTNILQTEQESSPTSQPSLSVVAQETTTRPTISPKLESTPISGKNPITDKPVIDQIRDNVNRSKSTPLHTDRVTTLPHSVSTLSSSTTAVAATSTKSHVGLNIGVRYTGKFRILIVDGEIAVHTTDLDDPSSPKYNMFADIVQTAVLEALSSYGNYIGNCQVVKYEPGSVIAYYLLEVREGAPITSPDIRTQLVKSFNHSDKPVFSRVSVDLHSFTVTRVQDGGDDDELPILGLEVSKDDEGGLSGGGVAAIVLTCILLAFVIVGLIVCVEYRENRRDRGRTVITAGRYEVKDSGENGSPV